MISSNTDSLSSLKSGHSDPVAAAVPPPLGKRILHAAANFLGAVLILGFGAAGFLYFGRQPEVPVDRSLQSTGTIASLVETTPANAWEGPFYLKVDGEASTYRILTISAEVTGRILKKPEWTRSGTFVNRGDLLFEIDPLNYQLEEEKLEALVAQAEEELRAVEVDLQNTGATLKLAEEDNLLQRNHLARVQSLFERKAASESEMDDAARQELASRNSLQTQQNQLRGLAQQKKTKQAALELAQVEIKRARVDLSRCRIVAPITGRIVDDLQEEGDYVRPGDALVHLSDFSRMEIKCSLRSEELAWIWQQRQLLDPEPIETSASSAENGPGTENRKADPIRMPQVGCEVVFEFGGVETVWDAHLSRCEGTGIDRATRMFPCRVMVDEPERTRVRSALVGTQMSPPTLLSGMYVTVRIPIVSPVPLLRVPVEAVRPGQQLWVVRDSRLQIVSVSLVHVSGETAVIRDEENVLQAGDRVITSPLPSVREGMEITMQAKTAEPSAVMEAKP